MNDILYEFKNLHHFLDSLTFGVNAVQGLKFEGLLLPWQQIYHLAFLFNFSTTPEVSSKRYFVEIC